MGKPLDKIDQQMIRLLRANARTPLVAIAKSIGLSRSATQERLKRLEDRGVIAGYTIVFKPPEASTLQAWIILCFDPGYACANVVPAILALPEVRLCHSLAGSMDLLLQVETSSSRDLGRLREQLTAIEGIGRATTAPVLEAHYDGRPVWIPDPRG